MPSFPIIDTHLHLWDPGLLPYPWLKNVPLLNRPYLLDDYRRAFSGVDIEAMVFVQCEADFAAYEREADWVAEQARVDPRIKGLVAWAPLERGGAVAADLARLKRHGILRGIRRIIQFEDDIDFCLRPAFIEGVRTLRDFDLSFDICIDHRHMANILKFVAAIPDVPMILDHIGKPSIRDGALQPWSSQLRTLSRFPNVVCKMSGVATEARPDWTPADLRPFMDTVFDVFGFDRIMFGGDWPVTLQAIQPARWIALLDETLAGVGEADRRKFWRGNAARVYRLAV
ncbi:MAG: amidohydrolase family protein [Alphaproteobacteria bacterium]|nr:amidohydrolase family protein [Alphaproteobacteria bacterium]